MTKYMILPYKRSSYIFYKVYVWRIWFPIWVWARQLDLWYTKEEAEAYIEARKKIY